MKLNLDNLSDSIDTLERSLSSTKEAINLNLSLQIKESIQAGVIQKFEVAYELSWKMMKRWIQENVGSAIADGVTRRELFRIAIENQLITDLEIWMDFHHSRNETAHTYNALTAKAVFDSATLFLNEVKQLLSNLSQRND